MMNSKERVTRSEVMAIRSPERTKTWNPIAHAEVIKSLDAVLREKGIGIVKESYSVKNNGNNIFGTWVLDIEKRKKQITIGFRNSIAKLFFRGHMQRRQRDRLFQYDLSRRFIHRVP